MKENKYIKAFREAIEKLDICLNENNTYPFDKDREIIINKDSNSPIFINFKPLDNIVHVDIGGKYNMMDSRQLKLSYDEAKDFWNKCVDNNGVERTFEFIFDDKDSKNKPYYALEPKSEKEVIKNIYKI